MSRSVKKHPYRGSRRFDRSCRNHGSCPYCRDGRQYASRKRELSSLEDTDSPVAVTPRRK